jgi:transposase
MAWKGVQMPKIKRKKYTAEFRQEAVRLLNSDPRPGREVARDLGVQQSMLYRWQREFGGGPSTVGSMSEALTPGEREELRRLRKENEQLRMEREILKKATAFFAKESK